MQPRATNRSGVGLGSGNPSERIDAVEALRGLALFGVMAIRATMEFRVSIFDQFLPRAARVRRSMTYAAPAGHRHLRLTVATTGIVIGAALTVAEPMQAPMAQHYLFAPVEWLLRSLIMANGSGWRADIRSAAAPVTIHVRHDHGAARPVFLHVSRRAVPHRIATGEIPGIDVVGPVVRRDAQPCRRPAALRGRVCDNGPRRLCRSQGCRCGLRRRVRGRPRQGACQCNTYRRCPDPHHLTSTCTRYGPQRLRLPRRGQLATPAKPHA
jgi:hypothetical protein